jgi:hypothetical protein
MEYTLAQHINDTEHHAMVPALCEHCMQTNLSKSTNLKVSQRNG